MIPFRAPKGRHEKPARRPALLTIETIEGSTRRRPGPPRHLRLTADNCSRARYADAPCQRMCVACWEAHR